MTAPFPLAARVLWTLTVLVTAGIAAPPVPVGLIGVGGDRVVQLSWEPSPGATSYTLRRRTTADSGSYSTVASGITGTTYTDTNRTNGTRYYYVVAAVDGTGTSANSQQARTVPYRRPDPGVVQWPLSRSTTEDGDAIRYAFGPRYIGRYDFHAGIDINALRGTPIYAMMAGTVTNIRTWDGVSTGGGNNVLVNHGDQMWTAYLHMDAFAPGLTLNQQVQAGTLLGYVGRTGASSNHLHLTYFVGLASESNNESRSLSPLEILPYGDRPTVTANFRTDGSNTVDLHLPAQQNTIRWIMLQGEGQTRFVDYYDVVAQGSTARDTQSQYGIYLNVAAPSQSYPADGGNVHLWVRPDPVGAFTVERIVVKDFDGVTLVDKSRVFAPPAPTGLEATTLSDTSLSLGWVAGGVVDVFAVERSATGTGSWIMRGTPAGTEPFWAEFGLQPTTTYYYRVRSINSGGNSPYSSVLAATTLSTYAAWRGIHLIDPSATDSSDDDGNGLPLLAEYALGITPGEQNGSRPQLTMEGTTLRLTYRRARSDVAYMVEAAGETLSDWSAAGVTQQAQVDGEWVTASVPFGAQGHRFVRLSLQRLP